MAARARLVGTKSLVSRQDALKMGEALGGTSERLHYTAAPKRPSGHGSALELRAAVALEDERALSRRWPALPTGQDDESRPS
jgi:hypothetical protein